MTILDSAEIESEVLALAVGQDTTDLEAKDDDTLIGEARWHHEQSEDAHRRSIYHAIECGRRLQVLHDRLAHRGRGHDEWSTALADEVGISRTYAFNLMELAQPENVQCIEQLGEDASIVRALTTIHDARRQQRRERLRAARAARLANLYPTQVELPAHLNIDVADCAALPVPDEMFDLIVTSPPYGIGIPYADGGDVAPADYWPLAAAWALEMKRVVRPDGGRLALNIALDTTWSTTFYADWVQVLLSAGWSIRHNITWNESNISRRTAWGSWLLPSAPHVLNPTEMIVVCHVGDYRRPARGRAGDILPTEQRDWSLAMWSFAGANARLIGHPAPFPEELPRRLIKLYSYPDDLVLDPFSGSGTTLVAAKRLGRYSVGVEINPVFCALTERNVQNVELAAAS